MTSSSPYHRQGSPRVSQQAEDMARKKRSLLPSVTEKDRRKSPENIRATPNGGWAWKCHYCGRDACDRSVKGIFLCRCHGGSTPRQRDPVQRQLHQEKTGQKLRTPGRPLMHGRYSRFPKVKVADILAEYYARKVESDARFHARCGRLIRNSQQLIRAERL